MVKKVKVQKKPVIKAQKPRRKVKYSARTKNFLKFQFGLDMKNFNNMERQSDWLEEKRQ